MNPILEFLLFLGVVIIPLFSALNSGCAHKQALDK